MTLRQLTQLEKDLGGLLEKHPEEKDVFQRMFVDLGFVKGVLSKISESPIPLSEHPGLGKPRADQPKFPKLFSIEDRGGSTCLQEKIEGSTNAPLYCSDDIYEAVSTAVVHLQFRKEDFNRFNLLEEAQKIHPPTTLPAVIVCMRLWMSLEKRLIKKNPHTNLYFIDEATASISNFEEMADAAWDQVFETPLKLEAPRNVLSRTE